jgi:ABC-type branched-subunit amino acid transport system substrate-binding protein
VPIYQEAGLPLVVYSPGDIEGEGIANLSPSFAELEGLAETVDAHPMLDAPDDIAAAADLVRQQSTDELLVGGPLWGMDQFYALAGPIEGDLYYVTGVMNPSDLGIEDDPALAHSLAPIGYDATLVALHAIIAADAPTRDAVAIALPSIQAVGLTGSISFNTSQRREGAPVHLYVWRDGQQHLIGGRDE